MTYLNILKKGICCLSLSAGIMGVHLPSRAQSFIKKIPDAAFVSIQQAPGSGDVFLAGQRNNSNSDNVILTARYTLAGSLLTHHYFRPDAALSMEWENGGNMLLLDGDSLIYSVLASGGANGGTLGALVKTDLNSSVNWYKRYRTSDSMSYNARGGWFGTFKASDNNYVSYGWSNPNIPGNPYDYAMGVAKTDANGNIVWGRHFGAPTLASPILAGFLYGGAETQTHKYIFGGNGLQSVLLSVDTNGNQLWTKVFKISNKSVHAIDLAVTPDSGFVVAGYYTPGSDKNGFLIKMNDTAGIQWAINIGDIAVEQFNSVTVDPQGNIVVAGYTNGSGFGLNDGLISKFDPNGHLLWTKIVGTAGQNEELTDVIPNKNGGYLAVGTSSVDSWLIGIKEDGTIGCSDSSITLPVVDISSNITFTAVTPTTFTYDTVFNEAVIDSGYSLNASSLACTFSDPSITGISSVLTERYTCSTDTLHVRLKNDGSDSLTGTLKIGILVNGTLKDSTEWNGSLAVGDTTWVSVSPNWIPDTAGNYEVCAVILSDNDYTGNDTFCTLLSVDTFPHPSITSEHDTLSAQNIYANYQWLYNGNVISGASSYQYTPTGNGNYSVITTTGTCTDTSDVYYYSGTGVQNINSSSLIHLYPNPFTDKINIQFEGNGTATLLNSTGLTISETTFSKSVSIPTSGLPAGIYIVKVTDKDGNIYVEKVVKIKN